MSEFRVNGSRLKQDAGSLSGYGNEMANISNELSSIRQLKGMTWKNSSTLLNEIRSQANEVREELAAMRSLYSALVDISTKYTSTESGVVSRTNVEKAGFISSLSTGAASVVLGATDSIQTKRDTSTKQKMGFIPSAAEFLKYSLKGQKEFNKWIKQQPFNKTVKNALKYMYSQSIGKKVKNVDKLYKVWSKIADGKYLDASYDFLKMVGGDKYKTIVTNAQGQTSFNWDGLEFAAAINTAKLVFAPDSYLIKNNEKYEDLARDKFLEGDYIGFGSALSADLVQVLGKGTVDAFCKTVSGLCDDIVSFGTDGKFTLSSINDLMYETCGFSGGTVFNAITKGISDGVDYVADHSLQTTCNIIVSFTKNIVSSSAKSIKSLVA